MMSTYAISRQSLENRHSTKDDLRNELRQVVRHLDESINRAWYDLGHPDVKHEVITCTHRVTKLIVALADKRQDQQPDYHADCSFEFNKYY